MTDASGRAPLAGVRVLELASGIAGPYAGRLLAMLGATVVKAEPDGGDPARSYPIDRAPLTGTSPLSLHLSVGKRNVSAGALPVEQLVEWSDVLVVDRVRQQLAGTPLEPAALEAAHAGPSVVASVTAWGYDADDPGAIEDELLVQAVSGVMTMTGDPGGAPLRLPGWQAQYLAGGYTAAGVLAALLMGGFHHVDVAWAHAMATGAQGSFQLFLQTGFQQPPAGPRPVQAFPGGALRCRDGFVVPGTVRRHDWEAQCAIYERPDLVEDPRFATREERGKHIDELLAEIQPWYDSHARDEIFAAALGAQWAMGRIMRATDTLTDAHLSARQFLGSVDGPDGSYVAPIQPWRSDGLPAGEARVHAMGEDDEWMITETANAPHATTTGDSVNVLAGLKIIELTTAWAGPFVGCALGAFGADVVKVEAANAFDIWRGPMPYRMMMRVIPEGKAPRDMSHDISANFNGLNRNKRGVSIDLSLPDGRAAFLRLVESADVVVANFTNRVLPALRLTYDDMRSVNPAIILLNMPALGMTGPSSEAAGYGSIIEGMGGMGARFGHPDEGARISQTFYPDPVAGLHGTVAVLAALVRRRRTGHGALIDLSQQEALWLQLAEGIVLASITGRDPERMGNEEPGLPDGQSGVRASDEVEGQWIAFARERSTTVNGYASARQDHRLAALWETVHHPVTGDTEALRVPIAIDGALPASCRPAPLFGQHTDEVLAEWAGLSPEEIAALRSSGAVEDTPSLTSAV